MDLAAAAALISAFSDKPLPKESLFFGEASLSGTIRRVNYMTQRLREGEKLGFSKAFIPANMSENPNTAMKCQPVTHLNEIARMIINGG
jgi:DNA repair protein RadA/Sms